MNFYFDNVNFHSGTGPNTFAARLAKELINLGHTITDPKNCDVHLAFIEQKTPKASHSRLIQRLDGIWFKPEEFVPLNRNMKITYLNAEHVIWQSNFDKQMTEKHWGKKMGSVIHNGIELLKIKIKNPGIRHLRQTYEKIFVCSASWHRQKRLKENIELFFSLKTKYPNSCLVIMGDSPDHIINYHDVFYTGLVSHDTCLEIYAAADWMIHLAWLDHCPNTVVEALSQNCPVICTDSGGTKEIVGKNGIIIPETTQYQFELTDYDAPYKLELPLLELPKLEIDNSYLNINKVAQKYISVTSEGIKWA